MAARLSRLAVGAAAMLALIGWGGLPQAWAQLAGQAVLLPNYDRVPIGEVGALEGGAFTARADDASAGWYNPAGLVKSPQSSISGNAGIYESVEAGLGQDTSSGFSSIPTFVGSKRFSETGGFAWGFTVVTPISFAVPLSGGVDGVSRDITTFVNPGSILEEVSFTAANLTATFDSSAELSTLAPGVAFGVALAESFRVGAGVRAHRVTFQVLDTSRLRQVGVTSGNFSNFLQSSETNWNAEATLLTYEFGFQWDLGEHFTIGATLRSESQLLSSQSDFSFNSIESFAYDLDGDDIPDTVQVVSRRTDNERQEFDFRLPRETAVGIAYVGETWELEFDLRRHAAIETFPVFGGAGIIQVEARNHTGSAQGQNPSPGPALQYSTKEVTNGSLGLKYKAGESLWFHFGYFQDKSPVGDVNDLPFDEIDFTGTTFGVTVLGQNTSSTLGLVRVSGESAEQNGVPPLKITTTAVSL